MNATEYPEGTETTENSEGTENPENTPHRPGETEDVERAAPPADERPATAEDTGTTSVYVRRGRTPTLGFWVTVLLVVPMVIALVISPFFEFQDASSVVTFVLIVGVFVGVPLAAVAAAIDAFRHRRGGPRGR